MSKSISEKNKKSEIIEAYNELLEKLEKSWKECTWRLNEKKWEEEVLVKKVNEYSVSWTEKELESFEKNFSLGLKSLSEQILKELETAWENIKEKLSRLEEIKKTIEIEENKLKEIYWIKNTAISLNSFLEIVEQEKQKWVEEKSEIEKQRKREDEEYKYNLEQARKKEEDQYQEKQKLTKEKFEDEMKSKKIEIESKESVLQENIKELEELRVFKEDFEKMKKDAIDQELAKQKEFLTKDHEIKFQLEKQSNDWEKKLLKQEIENLKQVIKMRDSQLEELKKEAEGSKERAQDLALKVIDSQKKEIKVMWKEE